MIKAVIFDLDDTLVPEIEYVKSGFHFVSDLVARKTDFDKCKIYDMLMSLFYIDPKFVFNRLLNKLNIPYTESDISLLVEAYRNHEPELFFYDDVLPCLEELYRRGIKTGIITDGYITTQQRKLNVLNANKYFEQIIITEELGREYWKPHPKAFEIMVKILDVDFKEAIYVGDNPEKDFYIGNIYPIDTVRIVREGSLKNNNYYKDVLEHHRIDDLFGLLNIIVDS